jgi:hypothetical protein
MEYKKAVELIEKEYETIRESSHNKIIRTGLTYDGCRGFCVSIYDDNGVALITDLGETKEVFDEVSKAEWEELCEEHGFEFRHWRIVREFSSINDLYEYIKFLDFISDKYFKLDN